MLAAAIIFAALALCVLVTLALYSLPTRRERLAAAALAGLLADHKDHADEREGDETCPQAVARLAVQHADDLIARLDSTGGEP